MASTFHGIEVSKRGLFAQQTALNTTGHNISNANTEGYTRQRANMQATTGIPYVSLQSSTEAGILGTGVQVTDLQRLRDSFIDVQYRAENKDYGYWEAKASGLTQIEAIMNEPSDTGLQSVMDQFWQSWEDLSNDPASLSSRVVVRERAIAVADTLAANVDSLTQLQTDLDDKVATDAMQINSIATQIADLNTQISKLVPTGYEPNDLYDQRDVLIDKLSKMVTTTVTQTDNGMVNVMIDGQALVTGRQKSDFTAVKNATTGFYDLTLGGQAFTPLSGSLLGTMEARGIAQPDPTTGNMVVTGDIPAMLQRLDALATNMAKEINDLHRTGLSLNDIQNRAADPTAALQDLPFFVDRTAATADPSTKTYPTNAKNLMVNPAIMNSLNTIAAAQADSAGQAVEGDNQNALDIAALKFKTLSITVGTSGQPESTTLDDFYRYTIAQLGVDSQEAQRMEENTELLVQQIETQRQSVSGVSIDEEMANMIQFQHAYSASARVMTSMDEILDKMINGMGRVGL
ncbi:flagellar hook-associated protein FlgK [Brevibacillus fulvus]|uniref:Flagellar hook-associated protein 1 n=1 Tax=Brevibacillus fulvus TaxID=1125967 RepID=A0A938Y4M1_9BACL|nr:flagellar hook-associated protein FlgK [Brevibacillus fulvus]MBM7591507.1 flagellar hook-associated protein 1 FlgK [Brevibacillus fulvus]